MNRNWHRATPYATLERKGRTVFRKEGRQIAIFRTDDGLFACNNRCPHEGYPLAEGTVSDGCTLTCNWHNWKFDLRNGDNLYGGDRLRVYPVERRDDDVWIDLTEPTFEQKRADVLCNLRAAFEDHEYDRLARELERLRLIGGDPLDAVREAILWSYERLEFGWTHAYAGAADWLRLYDEHPQDAEIQLACLLEAIGHMAWDTLREEHYPYAQDSAPFNEARFLDALEREDEDSAVAMIRGALAGGSHFSDCESGLTRAALAHYNDFGHSLIYLGKAGDLIRRLGASVELPLLLSLVRSIRYAVREDRIPEFRKYAPTLTQWKKRGGKGTPHAGDYIGLGVNRALSRTAASSMNEPEPLYGALLGANAHNLLCFDMSWQSRYDNKIQDNVGWLDFTHGITFASAVRKQCSKFADTWPAGLLQLACFSGRNAPYTEEKVNLQKWRVSDPERFFANAIGGLFDHGRDEYIVSVHLVKTLMAARDEWQARGNSEPTELMLAALNRFLNSPLKRKHVRRTARQAIQFVAHDA